jgi:short-subunit dehydrogenase
MQINLTILGYSILQVNNACIGMMGGIESLSLENYDEVMNINTR